MTQLVKVESLGVIFNDRAALPTENIYYTILDDDSTPTGRNVYLAHSGGRGGRYPGHEHRWGHTSRHKLVSEEPLHLEESLGWMECCGRHGHIHEGQWTPCSDSLEPL